MRTVLHLFDTHTGWEQRIATGQLLDRLPNDEFAHVLATVSPTAVRELQHLGKPITRLGTAIGLNALRAASVTRFSRQVEPSVIHAWGPNAAASASATGIPVVLELFDPAVAAQSAKILRTLSTAGRLAVTCSADWIRRRLVENGVPPGQCVVIRPATDFNLINRARRRDVREELGVTRNHLLIITPEPATRASGHFEAVNAAMLLNDVRRDIRIIVPGESPEQDRIARFAPTIPTENALICPGPEYRFEELLPHADVMIVAARGDSSTTAVAWAMAAGVAVVGAATHSIAELIAHKVGGLLYKPAKDGKNTCEIVNLLWDRESQAKVKEVARGQAYEVFGLRRFAEQHARLYANLLSGDSLTDGITDPAQTA